MLLEGGVIDDLLGVGGQPGAGFPRFRLSLIRSRARPTSCIVC